MPKKEGFEGPLRPGKCPASRPPRLPDPKPRPNYQVTDPLTFIEQLSKPQCLFDEICDEIETGPFSILSEKGKDKIRTWVRQALQDGFDRGLKAGKKERKKK